MSLRFGYGLNGFTDHRLTDALAVLADLGYDGVALTLDHAHLDPFAPELAARTADVAALLARHGLGVMVETGGRYVLDPRRKHEPTLVSDDHTEAVAAQECGHLGCSGGELGRERVEVGVVERERDPVVAEVGEHGQRIAQPVVGEAVEAISEAQTHVADTRLIA